MRTTKQLPMTFKKFLIWYMCVILVLYGSTLFAINYLSSQGLLGAYARYAYNILIYKPFHIICAIHFSLDLPRAFEYALLLPYIIVLTLPLAFAVKYLLMRKRMPFYML